MTKLTDDIVYSTDPFCPPYRFVVGRHTKWDESDDKITHIIDEPALAYEIYQSEVEADKGTAREYVYDWYLKDSFRRDAKDLCKDYYDRKIIMFGNKNQRKT